jgi:hypothetical protein
LAGTIGLFVKFSTLQEYGVDKVFFLENHNVDASQRNVVFLVRGENAKKARTVAGMLSFHWFLQSICALPAASSRPPWDHKDRTDRYPNLPLCSFKSDPNIESSQSAKTSAYHITHHDSLHE